MRSLDPTPYIVVYGVVVFLTLWLIYGSFIVRGLLYARSKGIGLFSWTASDDIRILRQADSHAAFLHKRSLRWMIITGIIWLLGFVVMCLTLYLLHRSGTIV